MIASYRSKLYNDDPKELPLKNMIDGRAFAIKND